MRFVRSIALVASVVLLVGTFLGILDRRDELQQDYDDQVVSASVSLTAGIESGIEGALELVSVVGVGISADDLALLGDDIEVCVLSAEGTDCTGPDLTQRAAYAEALEHDDDVAVAVADVEADAVLITTTQPTGVVMLLPPSAFVVDSIDAVLQEYAPDVEIVLSVVEDGGDPSDGVFSDDGQRVVTTVIADPPLAAGAIDVTAAVDVDIGLTGDNTATYLLLLALGTVLLAIVGWTVFVERRSLERQATTDEMTGLLNRREFERQSEEAMLNADRFETGLCVMLIDLDGFKGVNDTHGHHVGDQVLVECAKRLKAAVRDTDVVGRWGGDEFVILLPGLEQATAVRNSADRIGASIAGAPLAPDVHLTGSIGAALYPRHGHTFNDLIRAADGAMYGAKTTGVTHRLADSMSADDPTGTKYVGPDRRRSPTG